MHPQQRAMELAKEIYDIATKKGELIDKIEAKKRYDELRVVIMSLSNPIKETVEEDQAVGIKETAVTSNAIFEALNEIQKSDEIKAVAKDFPKLVRVLSSAIRGTNDRKIISLTFPREPNQLMKNSLSKMLEKLVLVFCTEGEAYVVTVSSGDKYTVTPHKYWTVVKDPVINPT